MNSFLLKTLGRWCAAPCSALIMLAASTPIVAQNASPSPASATHLINGYEPKWWKEAVVYQIYPRSFKDTNADGIGDLNGITEKLDYLQQLGVNVIWLCPHYDSPNTDNGYDIRDYRKIMREFGTMADFDRMLQGIKQRHMRLIIDLVVNHTSDENRWFVASRSWSTNAYSDYYIWRNGKPNPSDAAHPLPPNNYPSNFSGSAWQWEPARKQFYLHLFAVKQPDLNWDNPKTRQDVYSLMRFWLDKGVDGFRMDVIAFVSKPAGLPDLTPEQLKAPEFVFANGPHRDEYLQEMNREVLSKYDIMTVGEAYGISFEQEPQIVDDRRHELDMVFNFDAVRVNQNQGQWRPWTLPELKSIYDKHARDLGKHVWDTVFLSNHDNPRVVSSFGDTSTPDFRVRSAKLLEAMILTLRGTPFLYQGDEIGMTNYPFKTIADFDDIQVKNAYRAEVQTGHVTEAAFLENNRKVGRDNARTPMQWSSDANAGFSNAPRPWLALNPNYTTVNVKAELSNKDSVHEFTRKLIALHRAHPALIYGDYHDLDASHPHIYAYTRSLGEERFLIVLNFSAKPSSFQLPGSIKTHEIVLSNLPAAESNQSALHLQPWEARIYRY